MNFSLILEPLYCSRITHFNLQLLGTANMIKIKKMLLALAYKSLGGKLLILSLEGNLIGKYYTSEPIQYFSASQTYDSALDILTIYFQTKVFSCLSYKLAICFALSKDLNNPMRSQGHWIKHQSLTLTKMLLSSNWKMLLPSDCNIFLPASLLR